MMAGGPSLGTSNMGAPSTTSWRDSVTVDERKGLIQHLLHAFQTKPGYMPADKERLVKLVMRIEEKLWNHSTSKDDYLDQSTVNSRIRQLLANTHSSSAALQGQQQQQQQQAQPSGGAAAGSLQTAPLQPLTQQPQQQQQGGMGAVAAQLPQASQQLQDLSTQPLQFLGGIGALPNLSGPLLIKQEQQPAQMLQQSDLFGNGQAATTAAQLAAFRGQQMQVPTGMGAFAGMVPQGGAFDPSLAMMNGAGGALGGAGALAGNIGALGAAGGLGLGVGVGGLAFGGGGNVLAVAGAPAGVSTAESGVRQFMSNGAPVLMRGGGGGAANGGTVPQGGVPQGLGVPQGPGGMGGPIKLEGGGGGMIPVSQPSQQQQPATQQPRTQQQQLQQQQQQSQQQQLQQMQQQQQQLQQQQQQQQLQQQQMQFFSMGNGGGPGGMVPVPMAQMMPAPGLDMAAAAAAAGGQQQQRAGSGSFEDILMGEGPTAGLTAPARTESRKQQILKQQRWLLFLRHCARCTMAETECPYGGNCVVAKQLWQHLISCKSPTCTFPRCAPSRELLKHHQRCKSPQCPVCSPVKQYVAKQREAIFHKKLDASGVPREAQGRYMANMQARRAALAASTAAAGSAGGGGAMSAGGSIAVGGTGGVVGLAAPIVDPQAAAKRPRLHLQENMGTSLIEFFSDKQIRTHIHRLQLDGAADTAAARRPPSVLTSFDDLTGMVEEESCCKVCHRNKMTFEPPLLYCYGCNSRIKRNQTYHATPKHSEIRGIWCHSCVQSCPGDAMRLESFSIRKMELEKKKNDEEQEEAWVQCDSCEGWVHQICGLFNKGRNNEERGFLCPQCLLTGLERRQRSVPRERPQAMLTARDLPRCDLSDFIEERLQRAVAEERFARAKATGVAMEDVKTAEGLCVRVVNNVVKNMEVRPRFGNAFCKPGSRYHREAAYKQKVVLLFQQLEGVDMCLYCLYLQEYGQDCAPPNNRVVYLSYLDSVKYFEPEKVSAMGLNVALRTMVYHEVIMAYLQYAKAHGYVAMYIWACPPLSGDDYIMYCHPGRQKMPRSDRLREWYLNLLRRSQAEGTVAYISNLYDTFFEGGKDHRVDRPSALDIPYLEGDYWPGEAENLLAQMEGGLEGDGMGCVGSKGGRKGGKDKRWRPAPDATPAEQLLGRLGESIHGMREDFIVAHLYESCSHCRQYIDDDMRHYHPNPPQRVVIKSERTFDGIALDRPGGESSRAFALTRFQLCQGCFDREAGRAANGARPLGLPTGISLADLRSAPCPKLPPTVDTVPQIDNEFFDSRDQFLSLCQGNHYQFDTLRRARHSSMMVLYHLHNPSEPAFTVTCNVCQKDIKPGEGFSCVTCPDFDMCPACHSSPAVTHPHQLVPQATRKFDETRMRLTEEDRMRRDQSLHRTMTLLVHASDCRRPDCPSTNCAKVKALFNHAVSCTVKIKGGCTYCRRMWALLQAHSKMCIAAECPVPRCRELRALRRQQATRQEDMRRAAYRKMLLQQQMGGPAGGSQPGGY